jgi:acyl-[acyl-carrier-protein]-phospholipid O-acyltransferase/long-chain-fatty-acid--[acyl-carrier-protein] ligase
MVTALLPPLVKNALGGSEIVVTACLTAFAVGIAAGSALAAWLAAGRITVLPSVVAAVLVGAFAIDLGWTTWALTPPAEGRTVWDVFMSLQGIHIAVALAGLATSGGLFIVPVMAAVQAWAGTDRRARVMAGVNVLTAASMTGAALITATLQAAGFQPSLLFMALGIAGLFVAVVMVATMPAPLNKRASVMMAANGSDTDA